MNQERKFTYHFKLKKELKKILIQLQHAFKNQPTHTQKKNDKKGTYLTFRQWLR
jgi:cell division protein YceG involved in septum cleavage